MNIVFFDLETTDINPNTTEVLTGFFEVWDILNRVPIDSCYIECKPENYNHESFKIHGISYEKAMSFPDAEIGMREAFKFLIKYPKTVCCHANYENFGQKGYFDWQVLKNFCYRKDKLDWFYSKFREYNVLSTHTMAKGALDLRKKDLASLARYYQIDDLNHHNCISDVKTMVKIYFKIIDEKRSLLDFMEN